MKVYASSAGDRIIQLRDFSGSVIKSDTIYIPIGQSRINLNFDIPVGADFQLAGPSFPNLYRNNSGLSYPYTVTGLIDIKHSSTTSNPTGYYYYFYDWEIEEAPCLSPMVPVNAYINVGNPVADFNSVINSYQVAFNDMSFDANDHYWDFDDGNSSNQQYPIHTYSSFGTYNVKLKVSNACGDDSISIPIIVNSIKSVSSFESLIKIFPNPSKGIFNIYMNIENIEIKTLRIFTITGQTVYSILEPEDIIAIDLSFLKKGIYFVSFSGEDFILNKKLMIK